MDIQQNMFAIDNLNLYLVLHQLKPSTKLILQSQNYQTTIKYDKHKKTKHTIIKTSPEEINEFQKTLNKLNLKYSI